MRLIKRINILNIVLISIIIAGCQGNPFSDPPIHLVPNMDNQPKYKSQAKSTYFENNSTMRMPVEGTVPRGHLNESDEYYRGKNADDGTFVQDSPVEKNVTGLERGQERFNIYCAVCHGASGDGKGIMVQYGYVPPPSFHTEKIREYPDGQIFDVITNGIRNMPPYAAQVPVEDRWLIVNYLRALQLSQNADLNKLPEDVQQKINNR